MILNIPFNNKFKNLINLIDINIIQEKEIIIIVSYISHK